MRKFLLVFIQLLIGFSIAYFNFPFKFYKKIDFINGYSEKLCYNIGDTIKLHLNTSDSSDGYYFNLYDVNHQFYDSISIKCWNQENNTDSISKNGLGYHKSSSFVFGSNTKPGIYFFEDKIPIIINPILDSIDILFVVPEYNKQAQVHKITHNKSISLNNNYSFDPYTESLISYIDSLRSFYNIRIISDIELENTNSFDKAKLIVFYGEMRFWTEKSKNNFDNYILKGGHCMLLSTYFMTNVSVIDKELRKVIFNFDVKNKDNFIWDKAKKNNIESIGSHYFNISWKIYLKDVKPNSNYHFINKKHPLLKDIDTSNDLVIENHGFNYIKISKIENQIPIIDLAYNKFRKGELIAYNIESCRDNRVCISGISILQKTKNSGLILNYGTSAFVSKEYIGKQNVRKLIDNGINFLLTN